MIRLGPKKELVHVLCPDYFQVEKGARGSHSKRCFRPIFRELCKIFLACESSDQPTNLPQLELLASSPSYHDQYINVFSARNTFAIPIDPSRSCPSLPRPFYQLPASLTMMTALQLLLAMLLTTVAAEMLQSAAGEPTGIGGNIAGSTITIPTASPVPYNESCAVGTYSLNGSSLGLYCNTDDYSNWYYDWTSYASSITTLRWYGNMLTNSPTRIDLDVCVGNNAGSLIPYPL